MKMKFLSIVVLVAVAMLVFAAVAQAGTSSTTTAIIKDAQDGHLDGNWTATQVRAALAFVNGDPTLNMYTDVRGALQDFLASLPSPGVAGANGLMFTGGEVLVLFGAGTALMAGGLFLRRRRTA